MGEGEDVKCGYPDCQALLSFGATPGPHPAMCDRHFKDAEERVTARSDPAAFLGDPDRLATFIEKLRASGVKQFAHPSGLQVSFEPGPRPEKDPRW